MPPPAPSKAVPSAPKAKEPSAFIGFKYNATDRLRLFTQALYGVSRVQPISPARPATPAGHLVRDDLLRQSLSARAAPTGDERAERCGLQDAEAADNCRTCRTGADDQTEHNAHTMFTWSVGGEADLGEDWLVHVNWQSGKSHKFTLVRNDSALRRSDVPRAGCGDGPERHADLSRAALQSDAGAAALPRSPGETNKFGGPLLSPVGLDNTISGCVPLNPFGQGNVSQAAREYLVGDKWGTSDVRQRFGEVLLTGKLFDGWAGPISSAFGVTYRKESLVQEPFPYDVEALGPPLNAPALGIRGIPGGFTGGSPNLIQFSTGAADPGRIRCEGRVRRAAGADLRERSPPNDSTPTPPSAAPAIRASGRSTRTSSAWTSRPIETCACVPRCRATCAKPRSQSVSTFGARAAR